MKSKQPYAIAALSLAVLLAISIYRSSTLHEPVVGDIEIDSDAYRAGFRYADQVIMLDSRAVRSWEEFILQLRTKLGQNVKVELKRKTGETEEVSFVVTNKATILPGLSNEYRIPMLGLKTNSPLRRYGIQPGDRVLKINGESPRGWSDLPQLLQHQDPAKPINMDISSYLQPDKVKSIAVAPLTEPYSLKSLGIEDSTWFVSRIHLGSLASRLGVQYFDRILMVQGQPVTDGFDSERLSQALSFENKLQIDVVRGSEIRHLEIIPQKRLNTQLHGGLSETFKFLGLSGLTRVTTSKIINDRHPLLWWRYKIGGAI